MDDNGLYLLIPTSVASALVVTIFYVWLHQPWLIVMAMTRFQIFRLGFSVKYTRTSRMKLCYIEKGKPKLRVPSILILHGFSSSKAEFLELARNLEPHSHIVIIDLPGHGNSQKPPSNEEFSFLTYAQDIHDFVTITGFNQRCFHIVGQSLGGAIAAMYAAVFPEDLEMLSMACPLIKTPEKTDFMTDAENGHCKLINETLDEMREASGIVLHRAVEMPRQIWIGLLQMKQDKNPHYRKVFKSILDNQTANDKLMKEALVTVQTPTQIIWGQEDNVIHVSGIQVLENSLTDVRRIDLIKLCGHSIHIDCPVEFAKHLIEFRSQMTEEHL